MNALNPYLISNQKDFFYKAVFVLLVFSVYIDFPLVIAGILIPSVAAIVLSVPIIYSSFRLIWLSKERYALAYLYFFFLLSVLFFGEFDAIQERFKSFIQLSVVLFISFSSYIFLVQRKSFFLNLARILSFLIVFLSVLEVLNIIKPISDAFRFLVFSTDTVTYLYQSVDRDLYIAGFERPKVFSSEPSYVSIFFLVFSLAYIKLDKKFFVCVWLVLLGGVMLIVNPSPIGYMQIILVLYIFILEDKLVKVRLLAVMLLFMVLPIIYIVLPYFLSMVGRGVYSDSLLYASHTDINSSTLRLAVPVHTIKDIFDKYPLFGVGLGGKSTIESVSTLRETAQLVMGTNSLATVFMYFGALGGLFYYFLLFHLMSKIVKDFYILVLPLFIFYGSTLGGFEAIRLWFFLFVILAACHISHKAK